MESVDFLDLLKRNDFPSIKSPDFDRARELAAIINLQSSLADCLGFRPLLNDQIQDATHFAELRVRQEISHETSAVIRFSKFGKLTTILRAEKLGNEKLQLVLQELQKHGYVYVPATILESPYDGQIQGIETWMTRFFYYV
jgi:hypothetical protein